MENLYGRINLTTNAVEEINLTTAQLVDALGFNTVKDTDIALLGYFPQRNLDGSLNEYQRYGTPVLTFDTLSNTVKVERTAVNLDLDEAKALAILNIRQQLTDRINSPVAGTFQDQDTLLNFNVTVSQQENNLLYRQIRDQAMSAIGMWTYFVETGDTPPIYGPYVCATFELVLEDFSFHRITTIAAIEFMRQVAFFRQGWVFAARTAIADINAAVDIAALQALSTDLVDYLPGSSPPCA